MTNKYWNFTLLYFLTSCSQIDSSDKKIITKGDDTITKVEIKISQTDSVLILNKKNKK
jgi:hypothetical protein